MGEEEEPTSPTETMGKNRDNEVFPTRETNGEARMKNISRASLPHFHGLTSKYLDAFIFEFGVVCRT